VTSTSPPRSDLVGVGSAADPVAAVLEAHAAGRLLALRTSGSTGGARSVVRTTRSWFESFPAVASLTGLSEGARLWLPGPLGATMNLFAAVLARHLGADRVRTIEEATHAHLTPHQLDRLLEGGARLAGVHLTVAGDRLSRRLHDRAVQAGAEVAHYYGAAELSFVGWGSHEHDLRPFPGVEVEVRRGELWVRSPYLSQGYDGTPGAFRTDEHGFATVGDRGAFSGGVLTVHGRGGDSVTTGAATVRVADVETVLRAATAGEVVALGVPHRTLGHVVAAVLTERDDLLRARAAARDGLDAAQRPRMWFHLEVLPLTAAGKVDRAELARIVDGPGGVRLSTGPGGAR
jgi:acyl-CoA synthetase (AMP-forming)/AMP-acid ligase II